MHTRRRLAAYMGTVISWITLSTLDACKVSLREYMSVHSSERRFLPRMLQVAMEVELFAVRTRTFCT